MKDRFPRIMAVIMAGGSGTRFWPLSREMMPKQLLRICGEDTLIQQTVSRILPLVDRNDIFLVTSRELSVDIDAQLSSRFGGSWADNFILEPMAKNTAPAIGLAALHMNRVDPESVMVVLAADHVIRDADRMLEVLRTAVAVADEDHLVTLGITPNRPETGYGYIKSGKPFHAGNAFHVDSFVEKPDVETARGYLKDGRYSWNSGIFAWKTRVLLEEIRKHDPLLHDGLAEIGKAIGTAEESVVIDDVFRRLGAMSIDYAVMEKTDRAIVIPADIGWSDIGSWSALGEIAECDPSGNILKGNVLDLGSRNSVVYADDRLVATVGLKDLIVVDTPDATLVCSKDRAQDVKKVVERVKARNTGEHMVHRTVIRPWGSYTVLEAGSRYKVKRLEVLPGAKLSLQLHHHRCEHWVVVSGTARVTQGDRVFDVQRNESTYIPMATRHRLENPGEVPLHLIEIQTGDYLEEDDIVRFDDDYRRDEKTRRGFLPPVPRISA